MLELQLVVELVDFQVKLYDHLELSGGDILEVCKVLFLQDLN